MSKLITQVLFVLRKHFWGFVLFSIIIMVAFCSFSYVRSFQNASAILAFTYPNASDGLYPNGTFFNAYNIFTYEVIENAIRKAGLEGYVKPSNLMDEITIRPRSGASLISTQFIVSYAKGKDDQLGAVSAEGLLNAIIYAYIDHFHEIYSNDQIVLDLDIIDEKYSEYSDLVSYFNVALNQLQKYLSSQQINDKDFVSDDGTSFQDLINIIERYRLNSLVEIKSVINERGVTQSRDAYIKRLNYRTWKNSNAYDYNRKMQKLYKKILQDYESRLTSVVFIPSLDAERKFYMSKTKIGLDIHALNATNYEERAQELQRQINQTNQNISKITDQENLSMQAANATRLNSMIAELRKQLNATMEKIRLVEKKYSQYKNHNYVMVSPVEVSFMEHIKAKTAVVITGVLDVLLLVALVVLQQKKKGKGSN